MKKLSTSDRSALIKLASSLPKGSPERKVILASLKKEASQWKKSPASDDFDFYSTFEVAEFRGSLSIKKTGSRKVRTKWKAEVYWKTGYGNFGAKYAEQNFAGLSEGWPNLTDAVKDLTDFFTNYEAQHTFQAQRARQALGVVKTISAPVDLQPEAGPPVTPRALQLAFKGSGTTIAPRFDWNGREMTAEVDSPFTLSFYDPDTRNLASTLDMEKVYRVVVDAGKGTTATVTIKSRDGKFSKTFPAYQGPWKGKAVGQALWGISKDLARDTRLLKSPLLSSSDVKKIESLVVPWKM